MANAPAASAGRPNNEHESDASSGFASAPGFHAMREPRSHSSATPARGLGQRSVGGSCLALAWLSGWLAKIKCRGCQHIWLPQAPRCCC